MSIVSPRIKASQPTLATLAEPIITSRLTLELGPGSETVSPGENVGLFGRLLINGDFDEDGTVKLYDLVRLLKAYCSHPSDPQWDPACKISPYDPDHIGLYDAGVALNAYGQKSGGKPIEIYQSNDGVNWTKVDTVETWQGGSQEGWYAIEIPVPLDTPTPSVLYFKAYFPGGRY